MIRSALAVALVLAAHSAAFAANDVVISLAHGLLVPAGEKIDLPMIVTRDYDELSFMGMVYQDGGPVSEIVYIIPRFFGAKGAITDQTPRAIGRICYIGQSGATCGGGEASTIVKVGGPFMSVRLDNNTRQDMLVSLSVYRRK